MELVVKPFLKKEDKPTEIKIEVDWSGAGIMEISTYYKEWKNVTLHGLNMSVLGWKDGTKITITKKETVFFEAKKRCC